MEIIKIEKQKETTEHCTNSKGSGQVWFFRNDCMPLLGPFAYLPGESFFCPSKGLLVKVSFAELVEIIFTSHPLKATMDLILERLAKELTAKN